MGWTVWGVELLLGFAVLVLGLCYEVREAMGILRSVSRPLGGSEMSVSTGYFQTKLLDRRSGLGWGYNYVVDPPGGLGSWRCYIDDLVVEPQTLIFQNLNHEALAWRIIEPSTEPLQ